jgi:predicted ATPase
MPAGISDRLYLVAASGMKEFRPLYDALSHMGFYNLNPEVIRDLQSPDEGAVLRRDGSNLASVLGSLAKDDPKTRDRIVEFLSKVVPGILDVERKPIGKKETLEFRQTVGANESPWRFTAENMSDGTLRALGIITALFQSVNGGGKQVPFVGIEEPEAAVHPGAAGVLRDALQVASNRTQILVTSHSPDLLDDEGIQEGSILTVENDKGKTIIGPMNDANKSVIRDRLYTVGELMRIGPLLRDDKTNEGAYENQRDLFGELPE